MDAIIILTAKVVGWLVLVALGLFAFCYIFSLVYRLYKNVVGFKVVADAVKEYRKTHPEKFKHFDKVSKLLD